MQLDLFDKTANHILSAPSYPDFRARLLESDCRKCAIGARGRRTHIVADRGNPEAKIAIIGEGPGEQEDQQGKAFVGRSGQLLDKILESIGLDTNRHTLILNIVKCRATDEEGQNRPPTQEEADACMPYLRAQLQLVKPKVVLLLGATSLRHMAPGKKDFQMAKEAGKFLTLEEHPGVDFMVLYHPAALLRNPNLKPETWNHVKALKKHLMEKGLYPADARS